MASEPINPERSVQQHLTPFLTSFVKKFALDVLPAGLASVAGTLILTTCITPSPAPVASSVVRESAGPEMVSMLHDEHTMLVEFLRKDEQLRDASAKQADEERAALRVAIAERAAAQAAVTQTMSTTARGGAVREPVRVALGKPKPVETQAVAAPLPAAAQAQLTLSDHTTSAERPGFLRRRFDDVVEVVVKVPVWAQSAANWLTGDLLAARAPAQPVQTQRRFTDAIF